MNTDQRQAASAGQRSAGSADQRRAALSYKAAGVDIDAGRALVDTIQGVARRTRRPEVMGGLGGFGALCQLPAGYREPVLVAGADGVGTKLKLAADAGIHGGLGVDLVAMCVNDVVVAGAEPLLFLDYYATGALSVERAAAVVAGIGRGCEQAGCALVGGETAEMPGLYAGQDYDLAGFCVGVVEKSRIIDGARVAAGDALIALASSGPHSNGYSLIRKILDVSAARLDSPLADAASSAAPVASGTVAAGAIEAGALEAGALKADAFEAGALAVGTLGAALLAPTRIYVKPLLELLRAVEVKALAHITGGGLLENLPRTLPASACARVDTASWHWPAVFRWLQREGNVAREEMYRCFNCGVGMVACVAAERADEAIAILSAAGERAWRLGRVEPADGSGAAVKLDGA